MIKMTTREDPRTYVVSRNARSYVDGRRTDVNFRDGTGYEVANCASVWT